MATFHFLSGSLALEDKPFHRQISETIKDKFKNYHGYCGYKLTTLGRASDEDVPSFIVITKEHGIILIDVVEDKVLDSREHQGNEFWEIENNQFIKARNLVVSLYGEDVISRLRNNISLYDRRTRNIKTPITSLITFCQNSTAEVNSWYSKFFDYNIPYYTQEAFENALDNIPLLYNTDDDEIGKVCSLIEGTFIYERTTSTPIEQDLVTVNDYIQASLKTTFKQDEAQRYASFQLTPGPQRIRGLAGTGKTIVLSLKAALTHKKFSDFKILYLFNTQSLYQHVQTLISKYYTLEAKKAPDFLDKLHVFHAWGGRQKPGLYSTLCNKYGLMPLSLADVRGKSTDPVQYIYKDLLDKIGDNLQPEYDLVLIDEAQDFSPEIFEVIYKITKGNSADKRIIWAYDEFQSLKNTQIKGPSELFGKNKITGAPNLPDTILNGSYPGNIPKDFILPNCYRTPRPVLMIAHGVALGLYADKPNEMFYSKSEWEAIGYVVNNPDSLFINENDNVEIERPLENSRNILEQLMTARQKKAINLVRPEAFATNNEQIDFLATNIQRLIKTENVAPEEIIVVNLQGGNNKELMLSIQRKLTELDIDSVVPGYIESSDVFKPKGSVTITTPFRAKGNEANIVFVVNSQQVTKDFTLRMRNAFFVAVTRSRGWCFILGYGEGMNKLLEEINAIKADFPKFKFIAPEKDQVSRSKSFLNKSDKELNKYEEMLDLLENSPELMQLINERFNKS